MSAEEGNALDLLQRFNLSLRKALLAKFPCAYEQYVCISIPGIVIDTKKGGRYVKAPNLNGRDVLTAMQFPAACHWVDRR
jgi:hypothetical protein